MKGVERDVNRRIWFVVRTMKFYSNKKEKILLNNRANINFLKMILLNQVTELPVLYPDQEVYHTHINTPNFRYRVPF